MGWEAEVRSRACASGWTLHMDPLGIGIEFTDGDDAFWILPGEPMSTVAVDRDAVDVEHLLNTYVRVDALRRDVLHVLRYFAAERKVSLRREGRGSWSFEAHGTGSIDVGTSLTAAALQATDAATLLRDWWSGQIWFGKCPSPRLIARYLSQPPRETEFETGSPSQAEDADTGSIAQALVWLGVCKALDNPDALVDEASLRAAVEPTGRIGQTLVRLAERLPDARAHVEICTPGALQIEFSDGDDQFEVRTRSRALAARIADKGPEAVAEDLAARYRELDQQRGRALAAVRRAAGARGWKREDIGAPLLGVPEVTHLGGSCREVRFLPGRPLTKLLRGRSLPDALRAAFPDDADFADACVAQLEALDEGPEWSRGTLRPREVPAQPDLLVLTDDVIAEMDQRATESLRDWMRLKDTLYRYRDGRYHDAEVDTWSEGEAWVALAERRLGDEWVPADAVRVLLDAGDARGEAAARRHVESYEPHHEMDDADIEVAWRMRHEYPQIARRWFGPESDTDGYDYDGWRARLGDPVARWRLGGRSYEADDEPEVEVVRHWPAARQAALRADLLTWARTEHKFSPPAEGKLRLAAALGWGEVADALGENPFLLPGLLTIARRPDAFDEPGILMSGEILLDWSRLAPSPFLARLIATAATADLVGLAETAARRAVEINPSAGSGLTWALQAYGDMERNLRPILAIAWKRVRANEVAASEQGST